MFQSWGCCFANEDVAHLVGDGLQSEGLSKVDDVVDDLLLFSRWVRNLTYFIEILPNDSWLKFCHFFHVFVINMQVYRKKPNLSLRMVRRFSYDLIQIRLSDLKLFRKMADVVRHLLK